MTNKKISELPFGSSILSGNLFPIVQGNTTYKVSSSQILDYITGSTLNTLNTNTIFANNITASNITGSTAQFVSITGTYSGSGIGLTNIPNAALDNSTITIGSTTISLGSSATNISGISQLTATNAQFTNIEVIGTASIKQLNTINQTSLVVGDKYITILSGGVDHSGIDGAGILWGTSSGPSETTGALGEHAHILYNADEDALEIFPSLKVTGNLSVNEYTTLKNTLTLDNATITSPASVGSIFDTNINTITIGQAADSISIGTVAGTTKINNSLEVGVNVNITGTLSGTSAQFTEITASFSGSGSGLYNLTASGIDNFTNDVRGQFTPGANITIVNGVISSTATGGGTGSFATAINVITSSVTLNNSYRTVYADATTSSFTITLPLASTYNGIEYIIKKIDTSTSTTVTVSASGGETIDGFSHIPLDYRFEAITIQSDGTSSWYINSDASSEITLVAQGYINPVGSNNLYILTGTAAGGDNTNVQFSDSGVLSGSNNLTFNKITNTLSGTIAKFTILTASYISASYYEGIVAGATPGGIDTTLQFNSGSQLSGSDNLIYDYSSNTLSGTTAQFTVITASIISASQYYGFTGGGGSGSATPVGPEQSIQFNKTNQFSGSNNLIYNYNTNTLSGTIAQFTSITGTLFGTASFANNADLLDGINSTDFARLSVLNVFTQPNEFIDVTASNISGSTARFTSITGTHVGSGVGLINIPNSALNNSSITIGSTSISLGSSATIINGISQLTSTNAQFTNIEVLGTASIAQLNTLNQTSLVVGDKYITILSGGVNHSGIDGAGILWGTSSGPGETTGSLGEHAHLLYDASRDALKIFPGLYVTGNLNTNGNISGNIAQFTVITASIISASQYFGPVGGGGGDVSAAGTNNFSGINTFNINYITASAGITGSDARFNTLTASQITGRLLNLTTTVSTVTINTNIAENSHVILASASISDVTLTLPSASVAAYKQYIIKKIDPTVFKIIISGSGAQTIDGNLGKQIGTQYETITLISDGISQWFIL